jgi:hypothetical protein
MATIWPFCPVGGVSERLEWKTDVLQARSSEQRIAMRRVPLRSMSLSHMLSEQQASKAGQIIRFENANEYLLPHWGQAVRVGAVGIGTDVVVSGGFDGTELIAGSDAIVWQSADNFEQVSITAITDSTATLDSVTGTYTDALVMPLLDAAMPSGIGIDRDASVWRSVTAPFQINTNPDASSAGKVLLYIAVDNSGSMNTIVGSGSTTRMDNANAALKDLMDSLLATTKEHGADFDVWISGFWISKTTTTQTSIDAAKVATLKAWIDTMVPTVGGTDFREGVEDAPTFFASAAYEKGVIIFITDGLPSVAGKTAQEVADEARAIIDTIATPVEVYGINIDLVDTTYTAILDDTTADGVPVIAGDEPDALLAAIQAAVYPEYYGQYRGMDVVDDCFVVAGGSFAESFKLSLQGFDNGTANPYYLLNRTLADVGFQVRWQSQDMAVMYDVIRFIHSRKGKQRAFWVSTKSKDLTSADGITGTTFSVTDITRDDVPFHIEIVSAGTSYYREVTAIVENTDGTYDLTIDSALTLSDVDRISFLICARFDSDSIEIRHEPTYSSIQIPCLEIPEP